VEKGLPPSAFTMRRPFHPVRVENL
jgi:hypothetical protein